MHIDGLSFQILDTLGLIAHFRHSLHHVCVCLRQKSMATREAMLDGEEETTKYAKTMAPALLDFLNPELPNFET
jgi:hypothetical protein